MNINFLRSLDRWVGPVLLLAVAPAARLAAALLPGRKTPEACLPGNVKTCVFLKLKGGGSLIIALPALLAIRRAAPQTQFTLVCTPETKIYAELTGVFDHYCLIKDNSALPLVVTAIQALRAVCRTDLCIDLEANSILSAVFSAMTMACRRLGFVRPEESYCAMAYTDPLSFNVFAPVYIFYDQLARILGTSPATAAECREQLLRQIRKPGVPEKPAHERRIIGLAPFTSDFATERMMPADIWVRLLQPCMNGNTDFVLFGSAKNRPAGEKFADTIGRAAPEARIVNQCGKLDLAEAALEILSTDEFWAVDSGLLHIARQLDVTCKSFWGPTEPMQRLRSIDGLKEEVHYRDFACSPCVHVGGVPPCQGNNLCMTTMADPHPDRAPIWRMGKK